MSTNPSSITLPEFATHKTENLAKAYQDINLFTANQALQEALTREGAGWAHNEMGEIGGELGSEQWIQTGDDANRYPPVMKVYDRYGRRRDAFDFHPAWHQCLTWLKAKGVDTGAWADPKPGAHVRRAAIFQLFSEIECGSLCPTTMTYGAYAVLAREPERFGDWLDKLKSRTYDPRFIPAPQKRGVMMGMGMTEKQGGSDVRANTTRAEPLGDGWYRLVGHKWFFSAVMCDAFLVSAQEPEGVSCFLMPRFLPDGTQNAIHLMRAKDKLGDRSNSGAEVEFAGALAQRVGQAGKGIPTIIEMATYTRLDCANGSSGIMRSALSQAIYHCQNRKAFGKPLVDQPLMMNVLADMALEVEAHIALSMRVAGSFDRQGDAKEDALRRIITPIAKYWVTKRCPALVAEAMECHGGIGYIEEASLARLFRQSPLNAIWEGAGNVMALDLLRALTREADSMPALEDELMRAHGSNPYYDKHLDALKDDLQQGLKNPEVLEVQGRRLVEGLAVALQAGLLLRHAPDYVSQSFCASRLGEQQSRSGFGTLKAASPFKELINRALPPA